MAEIRIFGGRPYLVSDDHARLGIFTTRDQLAVLTDDDVAAITTGAVVGPQSYQDAGALTVTNDGAMRVDASPPRNLFASPSPFDGSPWSSKSPW